MRVLVVAIALAGALAACGGGGDEVKGPPPSAPEQIRLTSSAFSEGDAIPRQFTCDGQDVSPPLEWSGVPEGAAELALLVDDPDAPGGTFVHWVLFGLDPDTKKLDTGSVPAGAKQGRTSFGKTEYGGPCPPGGAPHRYMFTLYALSDRLNLEQGASAGDARSAIGPLAIAQGRLTGRYGR